MGIRILKGGMMTTVQDLAATGIRVRGFSVAGVMDAFIQNSQSSSG